MRTLEAAMAFGLAGDQLGRERLLAMGAHDLVRRFLGGDLGHVATLPVLSAAVSTRLITRAKAQLSRGSYPSFKG